MGTPSSARIIQDVDLVLKVLEIVYRENGATVEGLSDRNGHRRKVLRHLALLALSLCLEPFF